jgi:hypothetical protein
MATAAEEAPARLRDATLVIAVGFLAGQPIIVVNRPPEQTPPSTRIGWLLTAIHGDSSRYGRIRT